MREYRYVASHVDPTAGHDNIYNFFFFQNREDIYIHKIDLMEWKPNSPTTQELNPFSHKIPHMPAKKIIKINKDKAENA